MRTRPKFNRWNVPRLALLFGLLAALAMPGVAFAHAQLVRSNPANQATLAQSPPSVDLWFSELLENGFNTIEVFPAGQLQAGQRANLVQGTPQMDAKNKTHLSAVLPPLAPGEYVLEWRVLSRDGHSAPGRITFRVQ